MIEIGKILKPQGIKGEVKVSPSTNVAGVFNALKQCLVDGKVMHITSLSFRQGFLYIKFDEIKTRNDAENYRNKSLMVDKSLLEENKDEDDFLVDDLIGMVVYDEKGGLVGQILEVLNYGASDILVMKNGERTFEVPFVKGVFYKSGVKLVANSERLLEVMI